jgi:hypothetical protein
LIPRHNYFLFWNISKAWARWVLPFQFFTKFGKENQKSSQAQHIVQNQHSNFKVATIPSLITCLWLNTLADLSQFFSILSDLKCYRSTFSSFTNNLRNAKFREYVFSTCKMFWVFENRPL